jgi:hypothetical protein
MSEQDERIWTRRYKDVCQSLVYRIAQNRTGGSGSWQELKGSFRAKHNQTKLAGQVLQQRSSQQVHGDHGNNFIKNERE